MTVFQPATPVDKVVDFAECDDHFINNINKLVTSNNMNLKPHNKQTNYVLEAGIKRLITYSYIIFYRVKDLYN